MADIDGAAFGEDIGERAEEVQLVGVEGLAPLELVEAALALRGSGR